MGASNAIVAQTGYRPLSFRPDRLNFLSAGSSTRGAVSPEPCGCFNVEIEQYFHLVSLHCVRGDDGRILGFSGVAEDKLEMLFLRPEGRGQGIGKALLTHCAEHLGVRKADVNEQNPEALGFYLRMGFKVKSRSPLDSLGKPFPFCTWSSKHTGARRAAPL